MPYACLDQTALVVGHPEVRLMAAAAVPEEEELAELEPRKFLITYGATLGEALFKCAGKPSAVEEVEMMRMRKSDVAGLRMNVYAIVLWHWTTLLCQISRL